MASPISQAPLQRFWLLGFDGEDNEIADFVDDRAEAFAARALSRLAQLLRALAGTGPLVEERADVDGLSSIRWTPRESLPPCAAPRRSAPAGSRRCRSSRLHARRARIRRRARRRALHPRSRVRGTCQPVYERAARAA